MHLIFGSVDIFSLSHVMGEMRTSRAKLDNVQCTPMRRDYHRYPTPLAHYDCNQRT
jgi:hypothetical protein